MKLLSIVAVMLVALPGWARPNLVAVEKKTIKRVQATMVAPLNVGQPLKFKRVPATAGLRLAGTDLQVVFDSMNTNPTTRLSYSGFYGAGAGPFRYDDPAYKVYMVANDAAFAPGSAGKSANFVRVGAFWNPDGTVPASGTGSLAVAVYTASTFGDIMGPAISGPLTGVVGLFPNLGAGSYELSLPMGATGTGVAIPSGPGAVVVEFGLVENGQFTPMSSPRSVQPLQSTMVAPGDPQFPGTNPSSSTDLQWEDDTEPLQITNNPDYVFQDFTNTSGGPVNYAEQYGLDFTGLNRGILQAAVALFVDPAVARLNGTIEFGAWSGPRELPQEATFEIRNAATDALISTQTVSIADAQFSLLDPNPTTATNYSVYLQVGTWLRKKVAVSGAPGASGILFQLINGDVNGDNDVNLDDYFDLADAYRTAPGDAAWNPSADLDGSEFVDLDDYFILADSFRQSGD